MFEEWLKEFKNALLNIFVFEVMQMAREFVNYCFWNSRIFTYSQWVLLNTFFGGEMCQMYTRDVYSVAIHLQGVQECSIPCYRKI